MTEQVYEWLITMRSALLVSAVCVLLYILGKRMTMAFRKSETQVAFSLVDEFQSAISNGTLNVSFHVPKGPPMHVEIFGNFGSGRHACHVTGRRDVPWNAHTQL